MNNMERLERPSHLYPPGHISPSKYISSTESYCGLGGKRDSSLSCFSSRSSPPVFDSCTSGWKGTSAENIFFKGLQSEGPQQAERARYLQPTMENGGWGGPRVEEQPASRVSIAGRPSISPVWQVPEKKKSHSPPPPPPPLRSDSFAATKVFPYSEGPSGAANSKGRSTGKTAENNDMNGLRSYQEKTSENRHSLIPLTTKDFLHPGFAADHNHNQLQPNKLFSLSSNDVRQSHTTKLPAHQRQYSDESPHYLQTRTAPPAKSFQSVGSYYRSLQDLPTNPFGHKQVRHSTASLASLATHPNNEGHKRYYGMASKHSVQVAELQTRQGKAEGWRGKSDNLHSPNNSETIYQSSFKTNIKAKYSLPQFQMPYSETKEHTSNSHLGNGLHYNHQSSELSTRGRSPEDSTKRFVGPSDDMKKHFPTHQHHDHKTSLLRQQDPWVPQEDHRISPLQTPLLHSLAQENKTLSERQPAATTTGVKSPQEASDIVAVSTGKSSRRSDRYATTLRNEIQEKRAQLQKSRSAATLTCDAEDEEGEEWRYTKTSPSSGVSFSNTYKDHLKEAQAKVLQATSFQRRDLEPLGPEPPAAKTSNGRIRGRKRFPLAKRMHSFSEPDKIDKVGVEGDPQTGSFGERRKFFESKPAFSRPVLKSSQGMTLNADLGEKGKLKEKTPTEETPPFADATHLHPEQKQAFLEQQRLGTFAEYQATWNKQKKSSEGKTQGRYHSAENILDADAKEKAVCIHERSRSSPSADFYPQNIPSQWSDPNSQQSSCSTRLQYQHDQSPESTPSVPRNENPIPVLTDRRTKTDAANPSQDTHSLGLPSLSTSTSSQGFMPPHRTHLVPEPTSSYSPSEEFSSVTQANPAALQPLASTDTHHHTAPQTTSAGPTTAGSPRLGRMQGADTSTGASENFEVKKQPRPPSTASVLSSQTATLPPAADRGRSPSPHFSPQKLTDKPPVVSVQDGSTLRSENDSMLPVKMDVSSPGRKVPVRIIHTDSSLPQSSDYSSVSEVRPRVLSLSARECPASSLFGTYRQQIYHDQVSGPECNSAGALHSQEDAKREELARDIMGKDKSLVDILDQSGRMTTMDLMEGIFPKEEQLLEGALQRWRASSGSRLPTSSPRSMDRREEEDVPESMAVSLVPSSSYYNTSAPKAELLIKMKDMQEQLEEQESEDELDVDLASKKQELITSLAGKLEVLREARHSLQEDVEENEALGREVEATVQRLCQPNQLDKFRMFVGDLDKVVNLLLSLSGRLARVENALNGLEEEALPEEKRTLTEKRKLLMRQHEDAKELKENLDRRERLVSSIMEAHLDPESLDDYRHFVKMKSALIIEQRKLEDKIKLGEEQLKCLVESLPLEQRLML